MNNNKIVSRRTTNAFFLAIVLITGTISLSFPSFMTTGANAQAQPYYDGMNNDRRSYGNDNGYESQYQPSYKPDYNEPQYPSYGEDNRDKSKDSSKSVSLNKIKCINTNLNINGNNAGNVSIGNKGTAAEEGYVGAYSSGVSEYDNKRDRDFDCTINNNNTNTNVAGNETILPEPSKATLNVIKNVTCTYEEPGIVVSPCLQLEERITENQFLIEVTGNNPLPSQFPGSESGTIVTLGAGNYVVLETPDVTSIQADIFYLQNAFFTQTGIEYDIDGPFTTFSGDCTPVNLGSEATGTIGARESQTCEIENAFIVHPGA